MYGFWATVLKLMAMSIHCLWRSAHVREVSKGRDQSSFGPNVISDTLCKPKQYSWPLRKCPTVSLHSTAIAFTYIDTYFLMLRNSTLCMIKQMIPTGEKHSEVFSLTLIKTSTGTRWINKNRSKTSLRVDWRKVTDTTAAPSSAAVTGICQHFLDKIRYLVSGCNFTCSEGSPRGLHAGQNLAYRALTAESPALITSHRLKGAVPRRGWKPRWTDEWALVPVSLCKPPKRCSNSLQGCGFGKEFQRGVPFPTPPLLHGDKVYAVNACLAFESLTQAVLKVI